MNSPLQYPNTKLYFVRHGRTEWNRTGRLMGQTDIPLDAVGRSQAHSAARWMRALPIERVYASPLARARETGRILAEHLEVPFSEDERWREVDMGVLAGLTWSEVEESHPDFVQARQVDPASAARLDGESDQVMQRRAVDAFIDVIRECAGRTVAVASHGGTIKAVLAYILDMPLGDKWRLQIANGSVTRLRCSRRGWQIELLNYTDHLRDVREGGSPE